jgi:hypothetical protein
MLDSEKSIIKKMLAEFCVHLGHVVLVENIFSRASSG